MGLTKAALKKLAEKSTGSMSKTFMGPTASSRRIKKYNRGG